MFRVFRETLTSPTPRAWAPTVPAPPPTATVAESRALALLPSAFHVPGEKMEAQQAWPAWPSVAGCPISAIWHAVRASGHRLRRWHLLGTYRGFGQSSVRPSGFQARPRNSHLEAREVLKRRNSEYGFGGDEEKLLKMLCAHCAIFLRHLDTRED